MASDKFDYRIFNDCSFGRPYFYIWSNNISKRTIQEDHIPAESSNPPKLKDLAISKIANLLRSGQDALILEIPLKLQNLIKKLQDRPLTCLEDDSEDEE